MVPSVSSCQLSLWLKKTPFILVEYVEGHAALYIYPVVYPMGEPLSMYNLDQLIKARDRYFKHFEKLVTNIEYLIVILHDDYDFIIFFTHNNILAN